MGSLLNNKKESSSYRKSRSAKSKGERLGWKNLDEEKSTPLKDILGRGEIVEDSSCFTSTTYKKILV